MHIILPQLCEVNFLNLCYRQENHNFIKTYSSSYPSGLRACTCRQRALLQPAAWACAGTGDRATLPMRLENQGSRTGRELFSSREVGEIPPGWGWRTWLSFRPFDPPLKSPNKRVWFIPTPKRTGWKKNKNTRTQNEKGNKANDIKGTKCLRVDNCQFYTNYIA